MEIMRRIDRALVETGDAYIEELEAEVARLRAALVEERAKRLMEESPAFYAADFAAQEARAGLIDEGLLPPAEGHA
jgi:hypothetical protein